MSILICEVVRRWQGGHTTMPYSGSSMTWWQLVVRYLQICAWVKCIFMLVQFVVSVSVSVSASVHLLDTFAAGHINTVFNSITEFYGLHKALFYAVETSPHQVRLNWFSHICCSFSIWRDRLFRYMRSLVYPTDTFTSVSSWISLGLCQVVNCEQRFV